MTQFLGYVAGALLAILPIVNPLGAVMVFRDAPGDVVRCANCQSVILVAVPVPTGIRVSFQSLRWIEISGE